MDPTSVTLLQIGLWALAAVMLALLAAAVMADDQMRRWRRLAEASRLSGHPIDTTEAQTVDLSFKLPANAEPLFVLTSPTKGELAMTNNTRIYFVQLKGTADIYLVKATNPAVALRAIAKRQFEVHVATQDDLLKYAGACPVVDATHQERSLEDLLS